MAKQDYYNVLGVEKNAGQDDLERAYRKLVKQYHPDANPGNKEAEQKFKEISEAYSILKDEDKRAAYDRYGHAAFENGGGGAGGFGGFDFSNMGGMNFDLGDIFGDLFGGGSGRRRGPRRGADVQKDIQIDFEEAIFGAEKQINLNIYDNCEICSGSGAKPGTHPETCSQCGGTGQERVQQQTMLGIMQTVRTCGRCGGTGKIVKEPCLDCKGKGIKLKNVNIAVSIPKGIDTGQSIRISGKGEPGEMGGEKGDLFITVHVRPHKDFTRKGTTLYYNQNVSFVQATLGAEVDIPTIYGTEKHSIRPGTQPGATITLKNKGVPNVRNSRQIGDMIVTVKVNIPTYLTERQKELLRQFDDEEADAKQPGDKNESKKGFFDNFRGKSK